MLRTWKELFIGLLTGIAVLFGLSIVKDESLASSKNLAIIIGFLTFYTSLFLLRYWRNEKQPFYYRRNCSC
ncbi:hypothetical protein [Pseudalkalibacillus hwajinpoensis]|uniref:hypothetical protein n=1 Tax=Guptibacillus hwajinpoensis TaxID=208199 RepID=UPI001CD2B8F3|nr:hypothetical protein [Pseudalkalibacillus hwajinpoensis]MCA0993746.1 hypothetical protein [Pseudalkalibacillus hwajinpoensis]